MQQFDDAHQDQPSRRSPMQKLARRLLAVFGVLVVALLAFAETNVGADPTVAPVSTGAPTISGTPGMGVLLTAGNGTWANQPSSYTYSWQRCTAPTACVVVGSAPTYTAVLADYGLTLRVTVTATNAIGSTSASSALSAAVNGGSVCPSATILWDGGAGTNAWGTAANWSPDRVPTTTDYVCIPAEAAGTGVATPATAPSVKGIHSYKPLTFATGLNSTDPVYESRIAGGSWSSGNLSGRVTVLDGAVLSVSGASAKYLWTAGTLPSVLTVAPGARLQVDGTNLSMYCNSSTALSSVVNNGTVEVRDVTGTALGVGGSSGCAGRSLVNNGTVVKSAGSALSTIAASMENHGSVSAASGTLGLSGGAPVGSSSGVYSGTGGVVSFTGSTATLGVGPTAARFAGTVTLNGSSAVVAGSVSLDAGSTFTVTTGQVTASVSGPGSLSIAGSAAVLSGDVAAGGARLWSAGQVTGAASVLDGAVLTASGTASKYLMASGTTPAVLTVAAGGRLVIDGTNLSLYCGSGTALVSLVNNGTVEVRDVTGSVVSSGGGTTCAGRSLVNNGTVVKSSGASLSTIAAAMENRSMVRAESGTLGLTGGAPAGSSVGTFSGSTGVVAFNGGTWNVGAGTNSGHIAGFVVMNSASAVLAGSVKLENGASLVVGAGQVTANVWGPGDLQIAGTSAVLSADVTAGGPRSWSAGQVTGNVSVLDGAVLSISGPSAKSVLASGSTPAVLTVAPGGRLVIDGPNLSLNCGSGTALVSLVNNGTIDVRDVGATAIGASGGSTCAGRSLVNNGTVVKSAGTGLSTVSSAVENRSMVRAESGTLGLTGGVPAGSSVGTFAGSGGVVSFNGGTASLGIGSTSAHFAGSIAMNGTVAVLAGKVRLDEASDFNVTAGQVTADVWGPGGLRITGSAAVLSSDVTAGGPRVWSAGQFVGSIAVREGALLSVTGPDPKFLTSLGSASAELNVASTARVVLDGPKMTMYCGSGNGNLSIVNDGTIEVRNGAAEVIALGGNAGCTGRTVLNRGTIVKTAGAVTAVIVPLLENRGVIRSESATLKISGTPPGSNNTGSFEGRYIVNESGLGAVAGDVEFAGDTALTDSSLAGRIVQSAGTLTGAVILADHDGETDPQATLVALGGTVRASIVGPGGFLLSGTAIWADGTVTRGGQHLDTASGALVDTSRVISGGRVEGDLTVQSDATLTLRGAPVMGANSILANDGHITWPGGVSYFVCATCTLISSEHAVIDLQHDGSGTIQIWNVARGHFWNDGLIRLTGDFPGVFLHFGDVVGPTQRGRAQIALTTPPWLQQLQARGATDPAVRAAAAQLALANLPFAIVHDVVEALNDGVMGSCVQASAGLGLTVDATGCSVSDSSGGEGISLTVGFAAGLNAGASVSAGQMVGSFNGVDRPAQIQDLSGYSWCANGSFSLPLLPPFSVEVTGSSCWAPDNGTPAIASTPIDMDAPLSARTGMQSNYAGIGVGVGIDFGISVGPSFTIVIPCSTIETVLGLPCAQPPSISSIAPQTGDIGGGTALHITGRHLQGVTRVDFVDTSTGTPRSATVLPTSPSTENGVDVIVPASPILTNGVRAAGPVKVVVSTGLGSSDVSLAAGAQTFTYVPSTPLAVTSSLPLPSAIVGKQYRTTLTANYGANWWVVSGTLPPGLVLDPASGVIHGVPTNLGSSTAGVRATDVLGRTADATITITVEEMPALGTENRVAAGSQHSCVVIPGGRVQCWGANSSGQLGTGDLTPSPVPRDVVNLDDALEVAANSDRTCARRAGGSVVCWGGSTLTMANGSLAPSSVPVAVSGVSDAVQIAVGSVHACAVRSSGDVTCWGGNGSGQLGRPGFVANLPAGDVPGVADALKVSAGASQTCALISDGTVDCWGDNYFGQLGNGTHTASADATTVIGVSGATDVAVGSGHACAVVGGGAVRCWGAGYWGELGNGVLSDSSTSVAVRDIAGATKVEAGAEYSCAVLGTSSVRCWGYNGSGAFGDTTTTSRVLSTVWGLTDVLDLAAGAGHGCAVLASGGVRCWGANAKGQIGFGIVSTGAPAAILNPVTVTGFP